MEEQEKVRVEVRVRARRRVRIFLVCCAEADRAGQGGLAQAKKESERVVRDGLSFACFAIGCSCVDSRMLCQEDRAGDATQHTGSTTPPPKPYRSALGARRISCSRPAGQAG